jgi:hypothetical protein
MNNEYPAWPSSLGEQEISNDEGERERRLDDEGDYGRR